MTFEDIINSIKAEFGAEIVVEANEKVMQPYLVVLPSALTKLFRFLKDNDLLFFDYLSCLTGVDNGPDKSLEVIYHLYSIPNNHSVVIRVFVDKLQPTIPSISDIYKSADWHEREAFDMFGILFENHPDLRRILMPSDWVGFPLRKDYQEQEEYHGIKVKY